MRPPKFLRWWTYREHVSEVVKPASCWWPWYKKKRGRMAMFENSKKKSTFNRSRGKTHREATRWRGEIGESPGKDNDSGQRKKKLM